MVANPKFFNIISSHLHCASRMRYPDLASLDYTHVAIKNECVIVQTNAVLQNLAQRPPYSLGVIGPAKEQQPWSAQGCRVFGREGNT